ncbi:MAG: hypothetical protein E7473_07720 [Ruminococcaceae bacterium]|nr:hypothetical protein [Oscillospiraceae bacterium]
MYNIQKGQKLSIPLSTVVDTSPLVDEISDTSATVGSLITIPVKAESPVGKEIKFEGESLPRGMSIDEETGVITWKPASSQVGENHVAITVSDGMLKTTIHFIVKVYGSTSGAPSGSGNGGGTGNGGNGGNGGTSTPSDEKENDVENGGSDVPQTPDSENVRFTDLGAHAWASDAINSLADKGIIKGTSETTFSPGNNITRADFAILLVRAFEKTSDNTENFADVSESDYFARELAVARNTGIVGGIGDNKFAPRENIKRCDMMLMVYRVIKDKLVGADIIRPEYEDFADVPEYAKEAVSALIGAGLVNGKNGLIAPNDNTTRAEVAVLLNRILNYLEK